ncbi:MAG: Rossmann-like and DUF2520 domain-containing protein [Fermentimonas sp.]|jgi:predicted short-subunit dehydrogenase-like oxidoreductase (DUF2520 family)
MDIVVIGSGNVSTNLSLSLKDVGHNIVQVYSRKIENAKDLGKRVDAIPIDDLKEIYTSADIYIICVKDDAIRNVIEGMPKVSGILAHTAGSVPIEVFKYGNEWCGKSSGYGVMYPLQTFSKNRRIDLKDVPFFLESSDSATMDNLKMLCAGISNNINVLDSESRKYVHLSAVFANNFSNHMFTIASKILEARNISFDVLKPLMKETVNKIEAMNPLDAQTGPAVRYDERVMQNHLKLLQSDHYKEIYQMISDSIHRHSMDK